MTAARSAQMRRNFLLAACGMAVLAGCGGGGGGGEKVRQPDVPVTPVTPVSNGPAGVTQADNAKVDQYLQDEMTKQAIPAVSLAVLREGRVVYAKAYGYSVATSQPAKPEDRFEIGSITKSFTASAVMLLVEEGKLSLDDKIEKHLGPLPASWSAITLRHLLSHTSGLPRDPDPAFFTALKNNQSFSEDEMLARFKTYAPLTAPGSSYGYSNVAYGVLGIMLHRVTGKPYGQFLQERIFTPLGMSSARIVNAAHPVAGSALGYRVENGRATRDELNSATRQYYSMAAGGIEVSALDMGKWDAALYGEKILKKSSLDQMWTVNALVQAADASSPVDIHYGLGWSLRTVGGHRWVYHSGAVPGFVSDFMRYPEDKLTVVVLTNANPANARQLARTVATMFEPGL